VFCSRSTGNCGVVHVEIYTQACMSVYHHDVLYMLSLHLVRFAAFVRIVSSSTCCGFSSPEGFPGLYELVPDACKTIDPLVDYFIDPAMVLPLFGLFINCNVYGCTLKAWFADYENRHRHRRVGSHWYLRTQNDSKKRRHFAFSWRLQRGTKRHGLVLLQSPQVCYIFISVVVYKRKEKAMKKSSNQTCRGKGALS
jgi:hypothetical protein